MEDREGEVRGNRGGLRIRASMLPVFASFPDCIRTTSESFRRNTSGQNVFISLRDILNGRSSELAFW